MNIKNNFINIIGTVSFFILILIAIFLTYDNDKHIKYYEKKISDKQEIIEQLRFDINVLELKLQKMEIKDNEY